jgi:hypothetical protein
MSVPYNVAVPTLGLAELKQAAELLIQGDVAVVGKPGTDGSPNTQYCPAIDGNALGAKWSTDCPLGLSPLVVSSTELYTPILYEVLAIDKLMLSRAPELIS